MSSRSLNELIDDIDQYRRNPSDIQRTIVDALEQASDGRYDAVDPTNPFIFLLEAATATAAAGIQRNERLLRLRYPSLAQTPEELYHHMSDADYLERFARPGRVTMTFLLAIDEIKNRAIEDERGIKRMRIPKDTQIEVEGYYFTFHYPIEIRLMPHGGMHVVYDTSEDSPLQTLESNQPDWQITRMPPSAGDLAYVEILRIDAELEQVRLVSKIETVSRSSGFTKTFELEDGQFYHARVYIEDDGQWKEINTTHSSLVYDPRRVTAQLYHLDDRLAVEIPQIYLSEQMLSSQVRIDIYTTHGDITHCLDRYEPRNFQATWRDLSKNESKYNQPIRGFNAITIFADDCIKGGSDGLDFEQLRRRVIENATGEINLPITPAQLENRVERLGFRVERNIDHVTNRIYVATRAMERPDTSTDINSVLGLTIRTLDTSARELTNIDTVYDNQDRITVGSGTLFELDQGRLYVVDQHRVDELESLDVAQFVDRINERSYLYNPFYYVYDMSSSLFDVRAYYLDNPTVLSKTFVEENETVGMQVSARRYGISKEESGYRLAIETLSGDVFKELDPENVRLYIAFQPKNETNYAFLQAEYLGKSENEDELIFEFFIETNFDIDQDHYLMTTNFQISEGADTDYGIYIDGYFDLIFAVDIPDEDAGEIERSSIDGFIPSFIKSDKTRGLTHERLHVRFGRSLDGLWRRNRTVVTGQEYQRYEKDIPAYYTETVFKRDDNGLIEIEYNDGEIEYKILHQEGDPVLDDEGNQVYKARKSDIKLDENGEPMLIEDRRRSRQVDLLLVEAPFAYISEGSSQRYLNESIDKIVEWSTTDMERLQKELLENTLIWFQPRSTIGDVSVLVEDGISTTISSDQRFVVEFYLDSRRYYDTQLREELSQIGVEEIDAELENDVVSINAIIKRIHDRVGDEIIDVSVTGFGDENQYKVLTVQDGSSRLGIRKRLRVLSDESLGVEDDVETRFIRHDVD